MHCGPVAGLPTVLMGRGTGNQCFPASGVLSCKIIVPSSWASLVAQTIKNLPAMREIQVQSLDLEDSRRKEWLSTLVFLPGEFHRQRSLAGYSRWCRKESDTTGHLSFTHSLLLSHVFWSSKHRDMWSEPHPPPPITTLQFNTCTSVKGSFTMWHASSQLLLTNNKTKIMWICKPYSAINTMCWDILYVLGAHFIISNLSSPTRRLLFISQRRPLRCRRMNCLPKASQTETADAGQPTLSLAPAVRSSGLSRTQSTTCRKHVLAGTLQEAPVPQRCPDTHRPGSREAPSHRTSSTFPSSQSPSEAGDRVSHPWDPEDLLPH